MDESNKLGALSSLMASYGEDDESDEESVPSDVSPRQMASEILAGLVTTASKGSRPDNAFTAVQEPSSGSEDEEDSDTDDSGNEVRIFYST